MTPTKSEILLPEPADARLLDLARGVLAMVWDAEAEPARLRPEVTTGTSRVPVVVKRQARLCLPLADGGFRTILLFRAEVAGAGIRSVAAVDTAGAVVATAGRSRRRADARAVLADLGAVGRDRLLRFLVGFGATLFGVARDSRWLELTRRVLEEIEGQQATLTLSCRVTDEIVLAQARQVPETSAGTDLILVDREGLRHATILDRVDQGGRTILTLSFPAGRPAGMATAVILGQESMAVLGMRTNASSGQSITAWIAASGAERPRVRRTALEILGRIADRVPQAQKLLLAVRATGGPAAMVIPSTLTVDLALPVESGLLLAGRLDNRHGLLSHLLVNRAGQTRRLDIETLKRWRGRDGTERFIVLAKQPAGLPAALPCWIELVSLAGERRSLGEMAGPPDRASTMAALAEIAESLGGQAMPADLLGALSALPDHSAEPQVEEIGAVVRAPRITLILPLDADPAIVRCRLAKIAREPGASRLELLHLADDTVPSEAARALLDGLQAVHGLSGTLISPPTGGCSAGKLLTTALARARGDVLIRVGEGILPTERGWTARLASFLGRRPTAMVAGLPILAADDTIEHAGGRLEQDSRGRARLTLPGKGLPATRRTASRRVQVAPSGCLALRRADASLLHRDLSRFGSVDGAMIAFSARAAAIGEAWTLGRPAMVHLATRQAPTALDALMEHADLVLATREADRAHALSPLSTIDATMPASRAA